MKRERGEAQHYFFIDLDISIPLSKLGKGKHIPIEGVKEGKK
jgi:hypothetical protein